MALAGSIPTETGVTTKNGVRVSLIPGNNTQKIELQQAVDDGTGHANVATAVSIIEMPPQPTSGTIYTDIEPPDGVKRFYRARHVYPNFTPGNWTPWSKGQAPYALTDPILLAQIVQIPAIPPGGVSKDTMDTGSSAAFGIAGRDDLVFNGNCEAGRGYWAATFNPAFASIFPDTATFAVETATPYKGSSSLKVTADAARSIFILQSTRAADDNSAGDALYSPVLPNTFFAASFICKSSVINKNIQFGICWFTDAKAFISMSTIGPGGTSPTAFTQFEGLVQAPANAYYAVPAVLILTADGTTVFTWDEMHIWRLRTPQDLAVQLDLGNQAANFSIDWSQVGSQKFTLTGSLTLSFLNMLPGAVYNLRFAQDGTGGRVLTLPGNVKFTGGITPAFDTTPNHLTELVLYYDGTNYLATLMESDGQPNVPTIIQTQQAAITNAAGFSQNVPAGTLFSNGQRLEIIVAGKKGATGGAPTLSLKFGATTIATLAFGAAAAQYFVHAILNRTGAATQVCTALIIVGGAATLVTATAPAETLANAIALAITSTTADAVDADQIIAKLLALGE